MDYLKYDWCATGNQSAPDSYKLMRNAPEKAGPPIVFGMCEWGTNKPWLWCKGVGHLWRTTFDIRPTWDGGRMVLSKGVQVENLIGITKILDLQVGLENYAVTEEANTSLLPTLVTSNKLEMRSFGIVVAVVFSAWVRRSVATQASSVPSFDTGQIISTIPPPYRGASQRG